MRANPSQCRHEFTCVDVVAGSPPFIRCLDCDDAWELDEYPRPVSEANATAVPIADTDPCLNADNDPTSEHAQWRRDNE